MDEAPKKSKKLQVAEVAGNAGLGMVPLVGSALAAAFVAAVSYGHGQRQQEWFEEVADAISELQARGELPPLAELVQNPAFVDGVVRATRIADATHNSEKRTALRNGILHAVGPDAPSEDQQTRFFRFVDEFSPVHLHVLAFCQDPRATLLAADITPPELAMGSRGHLLGMLPGMGDAAFTNLVFKDLTDAGLVSGALGVTMTGQGIYQPCISALGSRFLFFIEAP